MRILYKTESKTYKSTLPPTDRPRSTSRTWHDKRVTARFLCSTAFSTGGGGGGSYFPYILLNTDTAYISKLGLGEPSVISF